MSNAITNDSRARLKSFVARIERLIEDRKAINADIAEVKSEAKSEGFNPAIIQKVIARRAMDWSDRQEMDALLELYEDCIEETPLEALARRGTVDEEKDPTDDGLPHTGLNLGDGGVISAPTEVAPETGHDGNPRL